MSFTPFARYRNFTLANLKSLLEVYPDMAGSISWDFAKDLAEERLKGYKRTAYQQACQLGLEDRSTNSFKVHNYLYTFDDNNLTRYLVFWFKTYYAPNPYVKSDDEAFILYCRLCEDILQSENHSVSFEEFVEKNIGGKSDDILLNVIKAFAAPVKYKKVGNDDILYVSDEDVTAVESEMAFIKTNFPIGETKSERDFFERFSYQNFCKFYDEPEDPLVKDGEKLENVYDTRIELPFKQSKKCAQQLVDCIYGIDKFKRISSLLKINDKNIKIVTDDLGGNYLRYIFPRTSSDSYNDESRVFLKKEYEIPVDDSLETCRLSNQWVSTELNEATSSGLSLIALISIINANYSDVIKIYEEDGKWYLDILMREFKLEELSGREIEEQHSLVFNLLLKEPTESINNLPSDETIETQLVELLKDLSVLTLNEKNIITASLNKEFYWLSLDDSRKKEKLREKIQKGIRENPDKSFLYECDTLITGRLNDEAFKIDGSNVNILERNQLEEIRHIVSSNIEDEKANCNKPKIIRLVDAEQAKEELL